MEVYAGYQENTDHAVGRVVQAIEEMGLADNTLIIYIFGDNGASVEGTGERDIQRNDHPERHPAHDRTAIESDQSLRRPR